MRTKSKELKPRLTLMTRASLNCRESSILQCTAVVRSVPWIKRVATRHIRTTIPASYRVASPEASNFGRRISGVGNPQHWMRASGIAGDGIRRQKSRALDNAACGSVRSPASTNVDDQPAATEDQPIRNARLRRSVASFGSPCFSDQFHRAKMACETHSLLQTIVREQSETQPCILEP